MATYSELTNTKDRWGKFGESLRMAASLAAVQVLSPKSQFEIYKCAEIGGYTAVYEYIEGWLVNNKLTLKDMMGSYLDSTFVEIGNAVEKWFILLVTKYAFRNMFLGGAKSFRSDAMDYALAVGLRHLAGVGVAGWDNIPPADKNRTVAEAMAGVASGASASAGSKPVEETYGADGSVDP